MRGWQLVLACLVALMGVADALLPGSRVFGQTASVPCAGSVTSEKAAAEERIRALQIDLHAKRTHLRTSGKEGTHSPPVSSALTREIDDLEGRLLEAVYELECLRGDWEYVRGTGEVVEITTYYATNRKPAGRAAPGAFYSSDHAGTLHYGRVTISVPAAHTIGNLELPTLWKLELTADPKRHFVIRSVTPLSTKGASTELRDAALNSKLTSLLLFVHGYNMTFADAALRTAQLANDLAFPGVVMFYSWPSRGETRAYSRDLETAELATGPFDQLLEDLARMPFDHIYILAHSVGNRLVTRVLSGRREKAKDLSKIRGILLAAPDINAEIFKRDIAPVLSTLSSMRRTIYASSNDLALKASKAIHGYPRVGETTGGVFTYPGFETIDASSAAPLMRAYGHSYIFDSSIVLADLEDSLVHGRELAKRRLKRAGSPPNGYWVLE